MRKRRRKHWRGGQKAGAGYRLDEEQELARLARLIPSDELASGENSRVHKPWWMRSSAPPKDANLAETHQELVKPIAAPEQLVEAVLAVNAELLEYLKKSPQAVHGLSPRQFEELVAEILASYGYSVQLTRTTKDGGYDIFAINKDALGLESAWLVECKKYSPNRPVGVEIVRSFWAVKTDLRVASGLIATTSSFTRGAVAFKASRYDLALKDIGAITDWINAYRPHPGGRLHLRDNRLIIGNQNGPC